MSDPTPPAGTPDLPAENQASAPPAGEELPPLPDGGLSAAMPTWLRQAPSRPARTRVPATVELASLTEGVEVPEWLSDLSRRIEAGSGAEQQTRRALQGADADPGDHGRAQGPPLRTHAGRVGEALVPSRLSPEPRTTSETRSEEAEPSRAAAVRDAPEIGEPERVLEEPAAETAVTPRAPRIEPARETAERALRFRVRNAPGATDPAGRETASAPTPPVIPDQMRAPSPDRHPHPPRPIGAIALLALLLIALAAAGLWYYW